MEKVSKTVFDKIKNELDQIHKIIYDDIKSKFGKYLLDEEKIKDLNKFGGEIVVDSEESFGGKEPVPPGHGGRRKNDNKIHIYPNSPELLDDSANINELIYTLINDVVVHENFHFYAQPDIYDKDDKEHADDALFGHALTEGIVQYFTELYIEEHNLGKSKSNYKEEVLLVKRIVDNLKNQGKSMDDIISILLNKNQIEIINECTNGQHIKNEYVAKAKLHKQIKRFLEDVLKDLKVNIEHQHFYHDCNVEPDINKLYDKLKNQFPMYISTIDEMFQNFNNNLSADGLENEQHISL